MIEALAATAALRSTPEAAAWLRGQLGVAGAGFHAAFAAAGRHVGKAAIAREDAARIAAAGLLVPAGIGADECARGALLLAAVRAMPTNEHVDLVRDLLRRGEARERQSVLRVLAVLPEPARFADLAFEASRTTVPRVLEAIACDNAYPARYFTSDAFDQLVLAALRLGAPLGRLVGLTGRTTPELVALVEAYATERRAAGLPVPDDVMLVTERAP